MGGIGSKCESYKRIFEIYNLCFFIILIPRLDESLHVVKDEPNQYPRKISTNWRNLNRIKIDTAFQFGGITYFFDGKMFYEFDDQRMALKIRKPKLSAYKWMNCELMMTKDQIENTEKSYEHQLANGAEKSTYSVIKFFIYVVFVCWLF